jgi:hypothetical protein
LKFVGEQFFLAAAAQNIKRLVRFLTIGTEEKYFLKWKKDEQDNSRFKLDKYLLNICEKRKAPTDRTNARLCALRRRR